jgi:hypothetical protein
MLKCVQSEWNKRLLNDATETGKQSTALTLFMPLAPAFADARSVFATFATAKVINRVGVQ